MCGGLRTPHEIEPVAAADSRVKCSRRMKKDIAEEFTREFAGMTAKPVDLRELTSARRQLITDIQARLNGAAADFLIGLQSGEPGFTLIGLPQAADLPAIKWKILNLIKLIADNPDKNRAQSDELKSILQT